MLVDIITKTYIINHRVITKEVLKKLTNLFSNLSDKATKDLSNHMVATLYGIRVGMVSYTGPSFEEFNNNFTTHKKADFIQIILSASDKMQQLPARKVTLIVDKNVNKAISYLEVSGFDETWVKGVFDNFNEIFKNQPSRNVILHSPYFDMTLQVLGAFSLTVFAVYAAKTISSLNTFTAFQYSSVYLFVIIFIILSNIWTFVGKSLNYIRNTYYPKVDIREKARKQILLPVIGIILTPVFGWCVVYILDLMFKGP